MSTPLRVFQLLFLLLLGLGASGCQTTIKHQEIIPPGLTVKTSRAGTAEIRASGRIAIAGGISATEVMSEKEWQLAITEAIRQAGLFQGGVAGSPGDYLLEVEIMSTELPAMGFNMTATCNTRWKLVRRQGNVVLFEDFVRSSHTATVGDKFVGMARALLATRMAAQAAIREGVQRLDAAQF